MAPRSRTGKLMQGLFGRFQKKTEPVVSRPNSRKKKSSEPAAPAEIDGDEYPIAQRYDDDEDTNWADADTTSNENNPIVPPQRTIPGLDLATSSNNPDIDNWDDALPAATVKDSNVRQVRGKNRIPAPPSEDIWDDNLANPQFSIGGNSPQQEVSPDRLGQAVGLWTAMLAQFRRILPAPLRQLSDAIVTAIIIAIVTIAIWFIDSFALPGIDPSTATAPPQTVVTIQTTPVVNPEQVFIEAIQAQLQTITSQYPADLIQTLQIDPTSDRLLVRLNPIWYTLDDSQQNDLADRMWLQAKANHFTKLELQDNNSISIARSPVVGQHSIVLQR